MFNPNPNLAGGPPQFIWVPCEHHNCPDEECDDYKEIVEIAGKKR